MGTYTGITFMEKEMWYVCTTESYSVMTKNQIMLFSGQWMKLETIMRCKMSGTERQILHISPFLYVNIKTSQSGLQY